MLDNYTVILHVFNEEKHLARVIKAIRGQTTPPTLVFVVDDGSTDRTPNLLHELEIQHIHLPRGQLGEPYARRANAFNLAVNTARNLQPDVPFILKVDGDVEISPNYAESLLSHFTDRIAVVSGVSTQYRKINSVYNGAVMYRAKDLPNAPLVYGWDLKLMHSFITRGYTFKVVKNVSYTDLRPTRHGRPKPTRYLLNVLNRVKSEIVGLIWRIGRGVTESFARKAGYQSHTHKNEFMLFDRASGQGVLGVSGRNLQAKKGNKSHRNHKS